MDYVPFPIAQDPRPQESGAIVADRHNAEPISEVSENAAANSNQAGDEAPPDGQFPAPEAQSVVWGEIVDSLAAAAATHRESHAAIAKLTHRCQDLIERVFEREVLRPVALALISIADRRRDQAGRWLALLNQCRALEQHDAVLQVQLSIQANEADLIEVEAALAAISVFPYQVPGDVFDPAQQQCVTCLDTPDKSLNRKIAQHLRPGYQRDGVLMRRELVSVYVCSA